MLNDEDRVILWRGDRTFNIREVDLNTANVARIFKLIPSTIYFVADGGDVVQPGPTGYVDRINVGSQYEVCGEEGPASQAAETVPARQPGPFQFQARPAAAVGHPGPPPPRAARLFTRNILIGRVERGNLQVDGATLFIEFSQQEATVPLMTAKVKAELRTEEDIVLCDTHGHKLAESSGTTGISFWKQNARRILAIKNSQYEEIQRRKRRRTGVFEEDVREHVENLVEAAEELPAIGQALWELGQFARNRAATVALTEAQIASVKATFKCIICRDVMRNPVATSCCRSLIGCRTCVSQWARDEERCPKCRDQDFSTKNFDMTGMGEIISLLRDVIREED